MNTDRIAGAIKQFKGAIEEVTGHIFGDSKLTVDGKKDKIEGKLQNAVGGTKDTLKE